MTSNLKKFRLRAINNLLGDNIGWLDPDDASSDAIDQAPKKISVEERQKIELQKAERENRENITALLELRDMEDELSILLRLFDTQESLLRVMMTHYSREELKYQTLHGREYLAEALSRLEKYKQHVSDMLRRIDTIRGDVSGLRFYFSSISFSSHDMRKLPRMLNLLSFASMRKYLRCKHKSTMFTGSVFRRS